MVESKYGVCRMNVSAGNLEYETNIGDSSHGKHRYTVTMILAILICLILQRCIIFASQDLQMDFFGFYEGFRMFIKGMSPYYNTLYSYERLWADGLQTSARYPSTVFVIFSWLGLMKYGYAKAIWMLFIVSAIIGQILFIRKYLGEYAAIILAMLMLSFPAEFSLQRGGIDIILAFCITCFVILYLRNERMWLATALLAIVISIKIAPAIFALIYLKRKDYRGFLKLIFLVVLISAITFGVASLLYADTIPDFMRSFTNFDGLKNNYNLHSIREDVVDNWVVVDGWNWRFGMNYFGSYVSISLIRFVNYALMKLFDFKFDIIPFTFAAVLGVWFINMRSTAKTLLVQLLIAYPVLNPLAWGPSIVIMFIGLVYIFDDIRKMVVESNGKIGNNNYLRLGLFTIFVFIVLSPRYIPWEYHGLSEAIKCVSICALIFFAGMFQTKTDHPPENCTS